MWLKHPLLPPGLSIWRSVCVGVPSLIMAGFASAACAKNSTNICFTTNASPLTANVGGNNLDREVDRSGLSQRVLKSEYEA